MTAPATYYVGLDVSVKKTQVCIIKAFVEAKHLMTKFHTVRRDRKPK